MKRARFKMVKLTTHRYPRRFTGLTLVVILLGSFLYTGPALAATVSVSATVNGGPVNVSASATFPPGESGNLYVYRDSKYLGGTAGSGTITWSTTIDGAGLPSGEHTVRATAGDAEATGTFIIDNPESITISAPSVPQTPMNVTGSAQFYTRLNPGDTTGWVRLYKRRAGTEYWNYAISYASYDTPSVNYSSQEMSGGLIDIAGSKWTNGDWELQAEAWGANESSKYAYTTITIENPLSITSNVPSKPTAPIDVTGTARFIERKVSTDYSGQIHLYKRKVGTTYWGYAINYGTFYGPVVNFSCLDMVYGLIDVGGWSNGDWEIKSVATAPNSSTKEDIQVLTIENPISVSSSVPSHPKAPANVTGSVQFIERKDGALTGYITVHRRTSGTTSWSSQYCQKNCYENTVSFDLQADCGTALDVATWRNGDYDIGTIAHSPYESTKESVVPITVDNIPKISASCPPYVSGDFDITGSAVFTEPISGFKGRVYINIDIQSTSGALQKDYNAGDAARFSYAEMAGAPLNADTLGYGDHVAYIIGYAKNDTWSPWYEVHFRTGPPEADGSGNLKIVTP